MSIETVPDWAESDQTPSDCSISVGISGETELPLAEIVTGRGFLTGKSGSGKSNSVGVVVEELLDRGIPVCIIDPEGEYIGLKDQYTILHAGAHDTCDVTANATDARAIADIVLERHIPVILDTSEFLDSEVMNELVAGVARQLFEQQKTRQHPMLLVVEECHEFVPQSGGEDIKEMFITIAKRGRKRGLGLCGLSQRPASVDKDFITQCDWNVWHRLTWPNDVAVASEVLGDHAAAVEDLDVGESLIWADWTDACQRVQWRRKRTHDYGSAPAIERAIGSTPDRIEADVFDAFVSDADIDVSLPDAARACLDHLLDVLGGIGNEERYMLDYVRANEPVDPKPAYALAGGDPESKVVYDRIRTLREKQFIAKAGRGVYEYALPDRVESHLTFHPEIEERHILALVERLESEFEGIAAEPARSDTTPEPGDRLGRYRIHDNGNGGGYAQLGKPVTEYLDVGDGDAVTVTPLDDERRADIYPGTDGELVYSAYEHAHKDYAAFSLTAAGIAALGGEPGDSLRVTAAPDRTTRVTVSKSDENP